MPLAHILHVVFPRLARCWKFLPVLAVVLGGAFNAHAQRQTIDLSGDWKFIKQDAAPDAAFAQWETVQVPHSWNAQDGQNGKGDGYYRGPAWYAKTFDAPSGWKGKRVFIRFEGAFLVADVYLNGQQIGEHKGGFAAFAYELTPYLKTGENTLRVRVNNAQNPDVPPLSADFTMQGGIYRPVHLVVTGPTCITLLDYASPGVYLTPGKFSPQQAPVTVEAKLDSAVAAPVTLQAEVLDAKGAVVAKQSVNGQVPAGKIQPTKLLVNVPQPHLWNGRADPYLYTVRVSLLSEGKTIDSIDQPLGFRSAAFDDSTGFLLNGKPYPMHGVNRHQEKRDKGWALSDADHEEDIGLILDIGATCLRLAHYQQSNHVLDLCDKGGLLVWEEVPLVNAVSTSPAFLENAQQQLTEMILQGYNHPSIFVWSVFNELYMAKSPPVESVVGALTELAHQLDPSRPVVGASFTGDRKKLNAVPDQIGYNVYPGWYIPRVDGIGDYINKFSASVGGKRVAISEYGAGANPAHHEEGFPPKQPGTGGPFHPEEYQTYLHETQWEKMKDHPKVWGTFVWAMFDFAVDGRNEGGKPGVNDKGLVTEDRKIKKDAYFFYRANWNPEPMVYIASRRNTPRKQATTNVDVFANTGEVDLKVNGKSLGAVKPNDIHISRWENVTLQPGVNKIEAVSKADGKTLTDTCEWTLQ